MNTDTGNTFTQTLQKHCGSNLFLAGILLYIAGNVLTMPAGYGLLGLWGTLPRLFLILPVIGQFFVYSESKHKRELKNTLRTLKFSQIWAVITLVLLCINIPIAINAMFRGGNLAAVAGFHSIIISLPLIFFLISFRRMNKDVEQGIQSDEQSELRGVSRISIVGLICVALESMHIGMFAAFGRSIIFHAIYLIYGIADFGLSPSPAGILVGFMSMSGAIIFVVTLNRFNRDLRTE